MEQTISLRYMRTVQQLEKKTEEVDQLLKDAKSLDKENEMLRRHNEELLRRVEALQLNDRQREEEVSLLEGHVRKQQQKLQRYIDQEAHQQRQPLNAASQSQPSQLLTSQPTLQIDIKQAEPQTDRTSSPVPKKSVQKSVKAQQTSTPVLTPLPPPVPSADAKELVEAHKQLLESETSRVAVRKDLEVALAEGDRVKKDFANLQATVAELKHQLNVREDAIRDAVRREDGMKATLRHLNQRHVAAALESKEMEDIEAKALEGLKAELLMLGAENDRARDALQQERLRYRDAKGEFEKANQLLAKQKALFEAHQRISSEEIQALTLQLESMLVDMKASSDRTQSQAAEILKLQSQLSQQPASAPLAIVTPTSVTLRPETARFVDPEPVNPPSAIAGTRDEDNNAQTVRELLQRLDAVHKEKEEALLASTNAASLSAEKQRHIEALERELEGVKLKYEALKSFVSEHESVDKLRREKEQIQSEEIRRLHGELATSGEAASRSYIENLSLVSVKRMELDALRDIAAKCLLTATSTYRVVAAITKQRDIVPEEVDVASAPPINDPTVRLIYNDVMGAQLTLMYIKAATKSMIGAEVRAAAPKHSMEEGANPLLRSGQAAVASHSLHSAIAPRRTPSRYSEGPSLKDVIDEYRKTSPRRAAHLDTSTNVNVRDPLQMAQWEMCRLNLLEERNRSIAM